VAGCALGLDARHRALDSSLRSALEERYPGFALDTPGPAPRHDPVPVRARLIEDATPGDGFTTLRARVLEAQLGGRWRPVEGGVIVTVGGSGSARQGEGWVAGRRIEMPVTFRRPARYLNAGVGDFERDLALDGTTLLASVKSGLLVEVRDRGSLAQEIAARVRAHVRREVARFVGIHDATSAAVVAAVLIGDRTGLSDEVRTRLQAAGTYHLIAISGGNVAILTALCLGLLRLAGLSARPTSLASLVCVLAYASVVTAGVSVWRACTMAVLYLFARACDHRTPPWHALAL
jgi:competence protein ComEC